MIHCGGQETTISGWEPGVDAEVFWLPGAGAFPPVLAICRDSQGRLKGEASTSRQRQQCAPVLCLPSAGLVQPCVWGGGNVRRWRFRSPGQWLGCKRSFSQVGGRIAMGSYRFDSNTTSFSSDGRIMQVEYAIQSINQAGTVIGVLYSDGVVLAAEKKNTGKLVDYLFPEKMAKVDDHIITAIAGMTSDANHLVGYMRSVAQNFLYFYNEPIPVEQLVRSVCDEKHTYTQIGGLRPYGVSFMMAGYDHGLKKFQLFVTDPSGNYGGWRATAIGENNQTAQAMLKGQYREDMSATQAMDLTVKVLCKTLDSTSLSADKLEFAVVQGSPDPQVRVLGRGEVDALLKRYEATIKASAEAAAKD